MVCVDGVCRACAGWQTPVCGREPITVCMVCAAPKYPAVLRKLSRPIACACVMLSCGGRVVLVVEKMSSTACMLVVWPLRFWCAGVSVAVVVSQSVWSTEMRSRSTCTALSSQKRSELPTPLEEAPVCGLNPFRAVVLSYGAVHIGLQGLVNGCHQLCWGAIIFAVFGVL